MEKIDFPPPFILNYTLLFYIYFTNISYKLFKAMIWKLLI